MTARFRVVVADAIAAEGLEPLRNDDRFELIQAPGLTGEALARAIEGAHAVLVRSATRITRESLAYADKLSVIGRAGVGVDTIDVDAATEHGIAVLTAPAGNTISAAELAFALILSVARRVPAADQSMRAGAWDRKSFTGSELYGKTLGLVGAGRIGSEVARRARAFGMTVMAYDPYLTPERAGALEIELAPLDAVLRAADFLSVHVPLTEATTGLIGEEQLAHMRPGAILVNAARGGVVDEVALVQSLRAGHLRGAALDVFAEEPLPKDHPLRSLPNVVLTPHLGASTEEAQRNVAVEIAEAVRAALLEGDLSRAVNAPAIGGDDMRRLRPLLDLAQRLGRLAAAMVDGAVRTVELRYAGTSADGLRPLAASALIGLLEEVVGRSGINLVNALHRAESRGITLRQLRLPAEAGYGEYLELRLQADGTRSVGGALIAEGHPRLVRIDEFRVDVVPRGTLVVLRNRDVPGVIGRVGTILGDAGVNIAEYHQARLGAGGDALAAIGVDGRLAPALLEELRRVPEVKEVRQAQLD
ncbi:MAG: phosphoglycerate dehydrogenase [Gemmatimonadota bacterium]|nr:phosphoglycerate dehydrogenase [Gemmatimonadota bacterium]